MFKQNQEDVGRGLLTTDGKILLYRIGTVLQYSVNGQTRHTFVPVRNVTAQTFMNDLLENVFAVCRFGRKERKYLAGE